MAGRGTRRKASFAVLTLALVGGLAGAAGTASAQYPIPPSEPRVNPCVGELAGQLLCPDLRMAPPRHLYVTAGRRGRGKQILHAENDIRSRGEGPLEIRGERISKTQMYVEQAIHRTSGKPLLFDSPARLVFYPIPGQGRYWKFHFAALFSLWSLDSAGNRVARVRKGPKVNYCFRDLERTDPSGRSPRRAVYPACSQDPGERERTLGTSVGWSDIYPAGYYENYIGIEGLRGCFDFVITADPQDNLFENDETNNSGSRRVLLPATGKGRIRSC